MSNKSRPVLLRFFTSRTFNMANYFLEMRFFDVGIYIFKNLNFNHLFFIFNISQYTYNVIFIDRNPHGYMKCTYV